MLLRLLSSITLILLICIPANAAELLAYQNVPLKSFGRAQLLIPKDTAQDRVYLQVRLRKPTVGAIALIDNQTLVRAIGTAQTASVPLELTQKFGSNFRDVIVFPRSALQAAKQSIVFGLQNDNGKEIRIKIRGKKLSQIQANLR